MTSPKELLEQAITLKESEIKMVESSTTLNEMQRTSKIGALTRQLAGLMSKLEKAAPKSEEEIAAAAEAQVAYYSEFLAKHDYRYVKRGHVYVQTMPDGSYLTLKPQSLREAHPELTTNDDMVIFKAAMEREGRIYAEATKSFNPQEPWVLNLLSKDRWVQPKQGKQHEIFDYLMFSIGGGKDENIEHIEKVIRWKYLHPEEILLPALVLFGEGEVGKNLFVERVLSTIFGAEQVKVLQADFLFGNFNGLLAGATVCMINEMITDATNMEKFKATVGQTKFPVNEKYGLQYEADSTALIITGGNGVAAGVKLAGDKSDRRWSIIRVNKSLIAHIAELRFCSMDEAVAWFDSVKHNLWDKEQCAAWLHNLLGRWRHEHQRPLFLDGEDRRWLLNVQKRAWQGLCERIFGDPKFTHINTTLLYMMQKWYSKEFQPAVNKLMSDQAFYATLDAWLAKNHPEISRRTLHVVKGDKETSKPYYAHVDCGWKVADNDFTYVRVDDRGHPTYYVPELPADAA